MRSMKKRLLFFGLAGALASLAFAVPGSLCGQSSSSSQPKSSSTQSSSASDENGQELQSYTREKTPTLDPAGPTISLVSPEQVFVMAAGLNMCGYDEGLQGSAPVRQQVRDEINKALLASEDA